MNIRPATRADCADLAMLDDIAGHGLPYYLWQSAVWRGDARNALEWGRALYADTSQPCNWTNAMVAEVDGETAGASVGYYMPDDIDFPHEEDPALPPLMRIFARAAGTWVIDMVAVFGPFGRRGIARALLRDQYRRSGDQMVSLVAANDNAHALALYESEGFVEAAREPFVPFNNDQKTTHWLLLQRRSGQNSEGRGNHHGRQRL